MLPPENSLSTHSFIARPTEEEQEEPEPYAGDLEEARRSAARPA
ncbi:hypothetical protein [Streptomyces sp. NPDC017230]